MIPPRRLGRAAPALALLLASCATVPGEDRLAAADPLEGFNRGIWGINQAVDKVILKPVTKVYRAIVPRPARRGVTHFFSNLGEPFSAINNLLQGKPDRAARNLGRFVVNTTVGVAGLGDPATKMGLKPAPEDFGQTLARWGVNGGPYLVLPLLGPSTLRDGIGTGIAQFTDPYNICRSQCDLPSGVPLGLTVAYLIDTRSNLIDAGADGFLAGSADPYATARSAYLQRRRAAILDEDAIATATSTSTSENAALEAAVSELDGEAAPPVSADTPATKSAPAPGGVAPPEPSAADAVPGAADPEPDMAPAAAHGGSDPAGAAPEADAAATGASEGAAPAR
jgi:phospholipid-binding lipoprotein MlaA